MAHDRPRILFPALIGGFFIGALSALPIVNLANFCCCLWVVSGGVIAAYFARQDRRGAITIAEGALVGLLAGVVGAIVWTFISVPIQALTVPMQSRWLERAVENARDLPPQVAEWVRRMGSSSLTFFSLLLGFVYMLGVGVVFSTIGGMLGALFLGSGSRSSSSDVEVLPPEG